MTLLRKPSEPRPTDRDLRTRIDLSASWRALGRSERLPVPRRRAVLAVFGVRPWLETALASLRRLGGLLACRVQSSPIHGLGAILVLGEAFAERAGGRPVVKALARLPGPAGSDTLMISDGWPLPPEPRDQPGSREIMRLLSAVQGRPAILLGLRLPNTQSPALVCRALLATADGPVELQDLRTS